MFTYMCTVIYCAKLVLAEALATELKSNADDIKITSFYSVGDNGTQNNAPDNYGILLCIVMPGMWYNSIQIFFKLGSKAIFYRIKQTNWTEWYKFE